jgi:hypothetical protein
VVPCAASQAALLRADAWASQASCTNSANSCLVISPSRLACTSTELCPSKCGVVKNGVVSSWTRACLSASDSTQKTITSGSPSPVAASTASGRGVRKKTKDLPPTWYTGLPRAPWTTVTCGSPSASSCTSSTRAGRSAVTPGSVGADPVAMQDDGQRVGLAKGNPTHPSGLHTAGRSGLLTRRTRLLNPDAKRMRRRIDLTEQLKSASHAGRRPCDQQRPMASACGADRPTTARPMMLWPEAQAYSLVMRWHSRGCLQPTRPAGAPARRRRARCGRICFASSHWHLADRLMSGASFTAKVCLQRKQGTAEWSLLIHGVSCRAMCMVIAIPKYSLAALSDIGRTADLWS